jgi:secreted PhoX family phosphatase
MRKVTSWSVVLLLLAASVVAASILSSCGSSAAATGGSETTTKLAIADSSNNRILIYNTPISTDESASVVLGQADFFNQNANHGASASGNTLASPAGLATDSAGNLYVADFANCRVLQFQPPFTNSMSASFVIGQPQFTYSGSVGCFASAPASPASGMSTPSSVAVDRREDIWVADPNFGRVTEYVPPFTNGIVATVAIGQTSVDGTYACNGAGLGKNIPPPPTASMLCEPYAITFDSNGNLWVADTGNSRVLEFAPPFSTGMAASIELGQPAGDAFTSFGPNTGGISSSSLSAPKALTFDSSGNLWIADSDNNRVLEYVPPFANGMAATIVIGQGDFTHGAQNEGSSLAANTLSVPYGLSFDGRGNLIVGDNQNNRVLIFASPFSSGMNATTVIGQQNLISGAENQGDYSSPTSSTLWFPWSTLTF